VREEEVSSNSEGNVSSAQLDQKEINDIAQELKKGLKPVEPKPAEGAPAAAQKAEASEGTLNLKPKAPVAPSRTDDTIFIDSDGKFQLRSAEAEEAQVGKE
jgi:hypothetical protein